MSEFDIPGQRCPHCKNHVDGAAHLRFGEAGAAPQAGDFSVCSECGGVSTFTADLALRKLSTVEWVTYVGLLSRSRGD
jgi:hypothetical protein